MTDSKPKVVVAMSGGVDSSVAACLLHEQGYEVMGLFMRIGVDAPESSGPTQADSTHRQGCCSASDAADARFVAGKLGIPFFALNFKKDFDGLINYFSDEYASARTPNPCVMCNHKLKFGRLTEYADAVGARYIATGHYARIDRTNGTLLLRCAVDSRKDQSYVLFGVAPELLDRVIFPIGHLTKTQVRDQAARFGLPVCDKPDSVEICFVPDRDYARVVKERRPDAFTEGDVVNQEGVILGRHRGIGHFTVGQRRGLGIATGVPIYVTSVDSNSNTVTVGSRDRLLKRGLIAEGVRMAASGLGRSFRADAKIRYLHRAAPATVHLWDRVPSLSSDRLESRSHTARVIFDDPQLAPAPGQAVVFYGNDLVLGGGWIARSFDV
ncbi:MAG: tRNA 2-thiouridine(34) synthase MnmA [Phycisphaerae bacterium]